MKINALTLRNWLQEAAILDRNASVFIVELEEEFNPEDEIVLSLGPSAARSIEQPNNPGTGGTDSTGSQ